MPIHTPFLRALLFIVSTNLLVVDGIRLVDANFCLIKWLENSASEQEKANKPFSFPAGWEEEVKFQYSHDQFKIAAIRLFSENKTSRGHLIKDDVVHLSGFVTIFSPPPNCD